MFLGAGVAPPPSSEGNDAGVGEGEEAGGGLGIRSNIRYFVVSHRMILLRYASHLRQHLLNAAGVISL